ncbi:MAG: hypothetical protein ACREBG_10980 [Pyrinomonadaceae bacterium]
MAKGQMRNLEVFKIGDSHVNEFEYQKNQGQMTEQLEQHPDESGTGTRRPTRAERVKQIMAAAHKKVEKRRKKEAAKAGSSHKTPSTKRATKAASTNIGKKAGKK